jgi:DNA replication protein DnaC
MASNYVFESRDERIERMKRNNPGRPIELCTAVVDNMWDKRRESILGRIPERFKDAEVTDLGYLQEGAVNAINKILDSNTKNNSVGLILCGPTGSGKTYAGYALIKWLAQKNPEMISYFTSYPKAMQSLKTEFYSGAYEELGSTWDRLNNESGMYDGLILLDDVSSTKPTDFELDKLLAIIDKRVDNFMPFILTTNIKMEDWVSVFGERIASRLTGYCDVIEFEALDRRLDNKTDNAETHAE